jgi:hypothetical protein
MSKWKEIRNDYQDDGIMYIDAWLTDDDDEGGCGIATINLKTKEVTYFDEVAKTDKYAQEMINEVLNNIK